MIFITFLTSVVALLMTALPRAAAQGQSERARPVQYLNLTLNSSGFQQKELTTPAGLTLVPVRNRTFKEDVDIVIDRKAGSRLSTAALSQGRRKRHDNVNLQPGEYIIRVVGVPRWTAKLTVTAPRGGSQ